MRNRKQNPEEIVGFNLRLPRSLHTRIEKVARDEHRSLAAQIRHAVELHVDEAESKAAA